MNPILALLKRPQKSPASPSTKSLDQVVADIKSGKADARQTALGFLSKLTPQQKTAMKQMLPQIIQLSKTFGASEQSVAAFTAELQKYLK